ncbi:MAG: hypothetical protein LKH26_04000 [Lactobacillus sp.]|jgi:hypothetical protein|nr:hypothetical protein [Lactobacillus sp.]MCI1481680.1 hypothetical protein [Lactobacillus sp.]
MSKLKQFFKNVALAWWMLLVITVALLDIRYGWQGTMRFFSWDYPLSWILLATVVITVLAIVWPGGKKHEN